MSRVGFEPTIPVFDRAKTFHALDHAVTVISIKNRRRKGKRREENISYIKIIFKYGPIYISI
jgi:hypothetical protein